MCEWENAGHSHRHAVAQALLRLLESVCINAVFEKPFGHAALLPELFNDLSCMLYSLLEQLKQSLSI